MSQIATRRDFFRRTLKYGAVATAGAAGAAAAIPALMPNPLFAETKKTYEWPWPYTKLDPEAGRKLGHDSYWSGKGCSYAGFHGIIALLREAAGEPFNSLPSEIMIYGHGGGVGWGMLCGALNGPAAAISLVCEKKVADMLVSELFGWYAQTPLPTDLANQYGVEKKYAVNKFDQTIKACKSGSPLCHVSSSTWCNENGMEITCLQRKERCARLTGDAVAHAIQLLNDSHDGKFKSAFVIPETTAACNTCHGEGGEKVDALTKMDCLQCHEDHTKS